MATDEPRQESECDDTSPKDECAECDTTLIDELKCKAAGVAAEAAYNAEYQDKITAAQAEFTEIRNKYRKTRTEVTLDVQDMRHQIKRAIDRIKCLIKQERVVECLDEAWCDVKEELDKCWSGGCCVKEAECQFDTSNPPSDETELKKLIAEYVEKAAKAEACFKKLSEEPGALAQRVRDRKAELDAIQTMIGGDAATTDLKRLYAMAVVLQYRLWRIWNGFKETKDFVDCLCRALTCWTEGSAAIATLKGKLAVLECHKKAEDERCASLSANPVDEILTVYDKKCCEDPCPDTDDDDHDDGCGCDDQKKPDRPDQSSY
jgi:hypothetical protein